jgi:hypothetical protein
MAGHGFVLSGDIGKAFEGRRTGEVTPELLKQLRREFGPPPAIGLYVGSKRRPVSRLAGISDYRAVVTADLALLNQIIAELWSVGTIPQSLSEHLTARLLPIGTLRETCDGVPADATGGVLYIYRQPLAAASSVSPKNAEVTAAIMLLLNSSTPAAIRMRLTVELPIEAEIRDRSMPHQHIVLSSQAIDTLTLSLVIGPESPVQPKSEGLPALISAVTANFKTVLEAASNVDEPEISGQVGLGSSFPNSEVRVTQAGALTASAGAARQFVVAGVNVYAEQPDPNLYSEEALPDPPSNFVLLAHEQFASDILSAIIASGDLSAYINRLVARHVPFELAPFVALDGSVTVTDGDTVEISVDVKWDGACDFDTDLDFTLTILCGLTLENGTLVIATTPVQIEVSDWDELKCALLAVPVVGTIINLIVDAIANGLSSFLSGTSRSVLVSGTTSPLPGSEKVVQFGFTGLAMYPQGGAMRAEGEAQLVPDTLRTFVYLRLFEGPTLLLAEPLAEAAIELIEIYDFAPIPPTGARDEFRGRFEIYTSTTYARHSDVSLGQATTDTNGYARLAVICPQQAGIVSTTTTTTDFKTHEVTTETTQTPNVVGWSDLAVKVTDAAGTVLAGRRLIARNVINKRVGTREDPVVLLLHPLRLILPEPPS